MATPEELDAIIIEMAANLAALTAMVGRLITQRQTLSLNNGAVVVEVASGQVLEGETAATGPAGPMGPTGPKGHRGPTGLTGPPGGYMLPCVTGEVPPVLVYLPGGTLVGVVI